MVYVIFIAQIKTSLFIGRKFVIEVNTHLNIESK